jgi:hypothetical protein
MDALKNRGDHCHMGKIRASAPGPAGPTHISPDRWVALIDFSAI